MFFFLFPLILFDKLNCFNIKQVLGHAFSQPPGIGQTKRSTWNKNVCWVIKLKWIENWVTSINNSISWMISSEVLPHNILRPSQWFMVASFVSHKKQEDLYILLPLTLLLLLLLLELWSMHAYIYTYRERESWFQVFARRRRIYIWERCCRELQAMHIHGGGQAISGQSNQNGLSKVFKVWQVNLIMGFSYDKTIWLWVFRI